MSSASCPDTPTTRPASSSLSPRCRTPGVERPWTAKTPAIVMKPIAMRSVGLWRICSAARAVRTATRSVMNETFVVMTKCSTELTAGWFTSGVARSHPRIRSGESVATSRASGRTGTRESLDAGCSRDARDRGQKRLEIERLSHDVSRAEVRRLTREVARGGEHDDRDRATLFHPRGERPAVHHRHHQIEDDDVRIEVIEHLERIASVLRRLRKIAIVGEGCHKERSDIRIVIHHENTVTHRREASHRWG